MDFNNFTYLETGINTLYKLAVYILIHDVNMTSLSCKLK